MKFNAIVGLGRAEGRCLRLALLVDSWECKFPTAADKVPLGRW